MKVFVIDGQGSGGMHHYARNVFEAVSPNQPTTFLVVKSSALIGGNGKGLGGRLQKFGFKLFLKYNPLFHFFKAAVLLRIHQPDIAHFASNMEGLLWWVMACRLLGVGTLYTLHDPVPHQENRSRWSRVIGAIEKTFGTPTLFKTLDRVHIHSAALLDHKRANEVRIDRRKLCVVQHGGGITRTVAEGSSRPREIESMASELFVFLFFGRIEPYKGLSVLLESTRTLSEEGHRFALIIAGAGDLGPPEAWAGLPVTVLNRFIADEEIRAVFDRANMVILPYLEGTQTGVVPVAAAFERAAVVTRVGALPELVEHDRTGFVVDPDDSRALSMAMRTALGDPERMSRMGKEARRYMEERYAWPIVGRQLSQVYRSISEEG